MADRIYNLTYTCNNSDILTKTAAVTAALNQLDAQAMRTQGHLKGYATGSSTAANAGAKAADKYAASLTALQASALGAGSALSSIHAPALSVGGAMASSSLGILKFGGALSAVAIGHKVFSALMETTKDIEAKWKELAANAEKFRDTLRELSSIKGMAGPGNVLMKEVLQTSLETGVMPEETREAMAAYENIGPTVRRLGHWKPGGRADATEEEKKELESKTLMEAMKLGRRFGIDPATSAESLGLMAKAHTITSTEMAMTQLGMAFQGLSEGKTKYTEGAKGLNKMVSKLVDPKEAAEEGADPGRVQSFGEAGVYLGALSMGVASGQEAQHRAIQVSRTLNAFKPERKAELEKMGIKGGMDDTAKLIRLGEFFREKNIQDPITYMMERGLGAKYEVESTVAATKDAESLRQQLVEARKGKEGDQIGKKQIAASAYAEKHDQATIAAHGRAAAAVTELVEGAEGPEQYEEAKRNAETRLANSYKGYRGVMRQVAGIALTPYSLMTRGVSGAGYIREEGAHIALDRAAKSVGIDLSKDFPQVFSDDYKTRAVAFTEAADAIKAKGGDPYGQVATKAGVRARVGKLRDEAKPGGAGGGGAGGAAAGGGAIGGEGVGPVVKELQKINDKLGIAGGGIPAAMGPAPTPGGAVRVGES